MADYLLDTHAFVLSLVAPAKLGRRARAAAGRIDAGRDQGWIPAAVVAEVILLRELGRIGIGFPEVQATIEESPSLHFLPLDLQQMDIFSSLSGVRDPFDRLILSAARSIGAKLITKDEALSASGLIQVVWA